MMRGLLVCGWLSLACAAAHAGSAEFKILRLDGNNVRWQPAAAERSAVVTYAIATAPGEFPLARNCRKLVPMEPLVQRSKLTVGAIHSELAAAFAMWEAAANLSFKEVGEAQANILIGAQGEPEGWAFADVLFDSHAPEAMKPISKALVCLNPLKPWKIGFNGDLNSYDLRYTLAHEIGHAIGLDHPASSGEIMSYRYDEKFRVLQEGDIAGAVQIYGAPRAATKEISSAPGQRAQATPVEATSARSQVHNAGTRAFQSSP